MKTIVEVEDLSSLFDSWSNWVDAVFRYAELEKKRPSIWRILDDFKKSSDDSDGK